MNEKVTYKGALSHKSLKPPDLHLSISEVSYVAVISFVTHRRNSSGTHLHCHNLKTSYEILLLYVLYTCYCSGGGNRQLSLIVYFSVSKTLTVQCH